MLAQSRIALAWHFIVSWDMEASVKQCDNVEYGWYVVHMYEITRSINFLNLLGRANNPANLRKSSCSRIGVEFVQTRI